MTIGERDNIEWFPLLLYRRALLFVDFLPANMFIHFYEMGQKWQFSCQKFYLRIQYSRSKMTVRICHELRGKPVLLN